MAASGPRPIPARREYSMPPEGYSQMPQPQPYYPSPSQHQQPLPNVRDDVGIPPQQPVLSQPGSYGTRARTYSSTSTPGYNQYPQQSYGTTPPQVNPVPTQGYGVTPPQAYGTTPPRSDPRGPPSYGTSAPSYMPPNPHQYPPYQPAQQARLHPVDAVGYGATPPGAYTPPTRPRRGTASSTASSIDSDYSRGDRHRPTDRHRRRRMSYDPTDSPQDAYGYNQERRRRASDDAAYERRRKDRKTRRYSKAELEEMEHRPTVGESTIWAWNKLKGALGGSSSK